MFGPLTTSNPPQKKLQYSDSNQLQAKKEATFSD